MPIDFAHLPPTWERLLATGLLVSIRVSSLMLFAPVFSSKAIPMRIKAGFVFAIAFLLTPVVMELGPTPVINASSVLGELSVGLVFGFALSLMNEALSFAGQLLGIDFSFSLVNLMDPNSQIETPVLGQFLGWIGILVLLACGLERTMLAAFMRTFAAIPVGQAVMHANSGIELAHMTAGVLLGGLQLAAPVMCAALMVEVVVGLIARISPQLPVMAVNVPVKTLVSYGVLIASLGIWPLWIEHNFTNLLNAAERLVRG